MITIALYVIRSGDFFDINAIVCIGYCIAKDYRIIERGRYDFHVDDKDYNSDLIIKCVATATSPSFESVGIVKFLNMVEEYRAKETIEFVGDYADISWINYYMCKYLPDNRRQTLKGLSRHVIDIYSFGIILEEPDENTSPEQYAEYICISYKNKVRTNTISFYHHRK